MANTVNTTYLKPTKTRGARICAKCRGGQITIPYNDALSYQENHAAADAALCKKLGWTTDQK